MAIYHRNSQSENASTWAHAYACTRRPHTHTHTHMKCTVEYDGLRHRWVRRWAKSPIRDEQVLMHLSHGQTVPVVLMTCCLRAARFLSSSATHTHTHAFNGPLPGITQVSRYRKGKTNLDFTEARDSEWQWRMQACTSLQTDNHASTPPATTQFLQARCPSCRPTNSIK